MKYILKSVLLILALCVASWAATWTAVIDSVVKNPDGLTLAVAYHITDGVTNIPKNPEPLVSNSDPIAIKRIGQNAADLQNRIDKQKADAVALDPAKIVGPVDLTPKPPDPPTAEQIAEQQRRTDFAAAWLAYQEIHAGLVDGDEAKALSIAKAIYKTGDLNFNRF